MMLGFATATMVESTRIMKKPTSMAHNAFHGFATGWSGGSVGAVVAVMRVDAATRTRREPPPGSSVSSAVVWGEKSRRRP